MAEYIEREALLKRLKFKVETDTTYYHLKQRGLESAMAQVRKAPAADVVEVKRGRWIWDDNAMDWGLGGWVCSECQEKNDNIPAKPDINPYGWVGSFYCPNCGADMREVNDAN